MPFRLYTQKMILTYSGHLDKPSTIEYFKTNFKPTYEPTWIRMCHETGKEGEYKHTHIVIDWGKRFQSTNERIFDYDGVHPNIKTVGTKQHWNNAVKYLSKEDTDNADLKKKTSLAEFIWGHESVGDLLKGIEYKDLRNVMPMLKMYEHRPREVTEAPELKHDWQIALSEELDGKPHPRKVIWYCDLKGGAGKTEFVINKIAEDPNRFYCITQAGGQYHLATVIQTALESGWNGHCMLVDLSRDFEERESIYSALECIKNGVITGLKYKGGTCIFNKPHLVVMANFLPMREKMSADRWDIRMLEEGGLNINKPPQPSSPENLEKFLQRKTEK